MKRVVTDTVYQKAGTTDLTIWCGTEVNLPTHQIAMQIASWTAQEVYLLTKTAEAVAAQLATGRNVILIEGDINQSWQLVGYAACYFLTEVADIPYYELGTVLVHPERRCEGFGHHLYDAIEHLHDQIGGVLCGTTKDVRVVRIGEYHGLVVQPFVRLDKAVWSPLCYEASCFVAQPTNAQRCVNEQEHGGTCYLRCRQARNS